MSKEIEEKVVELRFDNKDFEYNAKTSMSTIDKLKKSLEFKGVAKGFKDVDNAAAKVDMSTLGRSVETIRTKFSAMEVVAVTALANITNSAVNAGKNLVKSLSIDQVTAGMSKYEQKTASVQTIMNATGKSIDEVNGYLEKLMWFSDETSYGFTDMTAALGQMTSSGGDIDNLIPLITGVANATAYAGKGAAEFSRVMYNLNQSYGAGYLQLMDWKSLELAGVGSKQLKQTFIDTAVAMGKIKKGEVTIANFSETLKDKWADTKVMEAAFGKFGEFTEKVYELSEDIENGNLSGYSEEIQKLAEAGKLETTADIMEALSKEYEGVGKKAFQSAQEAKSFTEAIDATKDAVSSGWMTTFELIFGNYEQAKVLWTELCNNLWDIFASGGESRNDLLQETFSIVKDGIDGRTRLIDGFKNIGSGLIGMIYAVREAFSEIIPPMTAERLYGLITKFTQFTEKLRLTDKTTGELNETGDKIKRTFKGVFAIFDIGRKIVVTILDAFAQLLGSDGFGSLASSLLDMTASLGDALTKLNEGFKTNGLAGFFTSIVSTISGVLESSVGTINSFGEAIGSVGKFIVGIANTIWKSVKPVFTWLAENVSVADIFAGLAGGGIFIVAKKVSGILDKIVDAVKKLFGGKGGFGIKELAKQFGDALGALHDSLSSFALGLKVSSLVMIAASIAILSASLRSLSGIDIKDLGKSITAIGLLLGGLILTLKGITSVINASGSKGLIKTAIALMLIASSIKILSKALVTISALSFPKLVKGLIGVGGGMLILTKALGKIAGSNVTLRTSIALLALAKSCDILAGALAKFGAMSWKEIGRGLSAMGGALFELVASMVILQKFGGFKSLTGSLGILIVVQALEPLANALIKFGSMTWKEIRKGLSAMGGALLEVALMSGTLGKIAGMSGLVGSGSIVLVTKGLDDLANALIKFGSMTWKEIGKGLSAMGGALLEVALMSGALGMIAGMSGFCGAGSIVIAIKGLDDLANALIKFGSMTWKEIRKGLSAMGGALLEVALMSGTLGKIAGLAGLIGAGTITVVVNCLDDLANALIKFGSMTWKEIRKGLSAMGGALLEVALMSGALGMIAGFSGIIGGASLWVTVQGLDDLANALIKFGSMSWAEIGRGLTAMGAAMLEVGAISGGLGYFTGLAGILGGASIWTTVQSLDDLANALIKFGSMSWDEVKNGLAAMGAALGEVAIGGLANSLSFLGGLSLSTITGPLADLADSVKKWADVTVPEGLADQLGILAEGVGKFTFNGLGAGALSEASASVGVLADSVKKWKDVTVPKDIVDNMDTLADGVKKFWNAGIGASALSDSAGAVGILADSIKKWKDVSVPDNIGTDIGKIADGVKKFSFAFAGGWSMSAIVGPLGKMAESIKKWDGVTVPSTIKKDLTNLANGINKFSFAFAGGWSLSAIVKPLGNLAGSIKKWDGVTIPEGLGAGLKSIADGIASFNTTVSVADIASGVDSLISSIKTLSETSYDAIIAGFTSLKNCVSTTMAGIVTIANEYTPQFSKIGENLALGFANGISLYSYVATNAAKTMAAKAAEAAKAELDEHSPSRVFEGIGKFTVLGFANGIRKNTKDATKSARIMSNDVLEATQDELGIHSPSIVFDKKVGRYIVRGIAEGIKKDMSAEEAAEKKAQNIVSAFKEALEKIDIKGQIEDNELKLWSLGEGKYAGDSKVYEKNVLKLTNDIKRAKEAETLYLNQWQEMEAYYKKGQVTETSVNEAKNEYLEAQIKRLNTENDLEAINKANAELEFENLKTKIELRDKELEVALESLGNDPSEDKLDALNRDHLVKELEDLNKQLKIETSQWLEVKTKAEQGKATQDEVNKAYKDYLEAKKQSVATQNEISKIDTDTAKRRNEELEEQYSLAVSNADIMYRLWEKTEGRNATGAQKDAKKLSMLSQQLASESSSLILARNEWEDAKNEYGESANEAQEAYNKYLQKQLDIATLQSDIADIHEKCAAREKAAASEYKDYVKKYAKYYEENGMSTAELEKDAKLVSGYDGNTSVNKMLSSTNSALNNVKDNPVYTQVVSGYKALGESYVDSLSAGFEAGMEVLVNTSVKLMKECLTKLEPTKDDWIQVGKNCVMGFVKGIEDNIYYAAMSAAKMAREALAAANEAFDINSPSRAFAEIGMYAAQGLAKGLNENSYLSNLAATSIGEQAIDKLRNTIRYISEVVDSEIDSQPTIRPVLDLSDVKSKASRLNTMFSNSLAMEVGAGMSKTNNIGDSQNGVSNAASGNTYQFTQNNYSPKALSRAEIYRQTKNQFAAMKGALK